MPIVYCEAAYPRGHLVFANIRCAVDNDHLIKSHYENTFFLSTGQNLREEDENFWRFF